MFGVDVFHSLAVADHIAVEAVFVAQQVGEEIAAGGHRDAVPVVVAAHDAHRPGFADHAAERVEIHLVEFARGDVGVGAAVAVAAALGDAVSRIVFECRGDALRLDAADHLDAQLGDQERVFAVALHDTAPAGIARHVENRGVDVLIAQDPGFVSGDLAGPVHQRPVPGRADGDGRRERCGAAVVQTVDALVGELHGMPSRVCSTNHRWIVFLASMCPV